MTHTVFMNINYDTQGIRKWIVGTSAGHRQLCRLMRARLQGNSGAHIGREGGGKRNGESSLNSLIFCFSAVQRWQLTGAEQGSAWSASKT